MKHIVLSLCLCLFIGLSATAQSWPRNSAGKVELSGKVSYPANVKTEAAREAFVRQWYMKNLTDFDAAQLADIERSNAKNGLSTYAGLPLIGTIQAQHGNLSFVNKISTSASGFSYKITDLHLSTSDITHSIEDALKAPKPEEKLALAELRQRMPR